MWISNNAEKRQKGPSSLRQEYREEHKKETQCTLRMLAGIKRPLWLPGSILVTHRHEGYLVALIFRQRAKPIECQVPSDIK